MDSKYQNQVSEWFYQWEALGRGWKVYENPVHLEPPFMHFYPYIEEPARAVDNGKGTGLLGKLLSFGRKTKKERPVTPHYTFQKEPKWFSSDAPFHELGLAPSFSQQAKVEEIEQFLLMLSYSKAPISFEIIGSHNEIQLQFACHEPDYHHLKGQLGAYFPQTIVTDQPGYLHSRCLPEATTLVVDFALQQEFMRPLSMTRQFQPDLLSGLLGVLEHIRSDEMAVVQVMFQSAVHPWAACIMEAVTDEAGGSFFADAPEMVPLAKEKVAYPLYGAVIRVLIQAQSEDRVQTIVENLYQTFSPIHKEGSNSLVPIINEVYPFEDHINDVLSRQSRRPGMLLNTRELMNLVHLPSPSVLASKLNRSVAKTKLAPGSTINQELILGINHHQGSTQEVSLGLQQRLRHLHLIGATGMGKSTLMLQMMVQDIQGGDGVTILDPHGDLIESVIPHIPPGRMQDVIYLDPADADYPVGINPLEAHSEVEKIVLSSDMVGMFKRLSTSWGDQMTSVLANAIAAFLESTTGGTLLGLRRFLVEKDFRVEFLHTVTDPHIVYYWQKEFPLLRSNSVGSLITRLNTFLRPKLIRNMMAQKEGLDFNEVLNKKRILLAKLSQGIIGEENSYLLGTLLVAKIHQAAQARQAMAKQNRHPHFLYIDEFQNFITPSMAGILSGARKYGLGLILAHQDLQQLFKQDMELGNSVISNSGTRICFRLGDLDAKKLESGFSYFDHTDLQSLSVGEALVRVGQAEHDFNLATEMLPEVDQAEATHTYQEVLRWSRHGFSRKREEVEAEILELTPTIKSTPPTPPKPKEQPPQAKPKPKADPIIEEKPPVPEPEPELEPETEEIPTIPEETPKQPIEEAAEAFKKREQEKQEASQHIYLQTYIKRMAEARGFRAIIEKPTPDEKGRVDVSLEREKPMIAVEVSVTTPAKHELQNITKCLKAGYTTVISTSKNKRHLAGIQALAESKLSKKQLEKVLFLDPEEVVQHLDEIVAKESSTEKRIKGYRVKVNFKPVNAEDAERKQEDIAKSVLKGMREEKK